MTGSTDEPNKCYLPIVSDALAESSGGLIVGTHLLREYYMIFDATDQDLRVGIGHPDFYVLLEDTETWLWVALPAGLLVVVFLICVITRKSKKQNPVTGTFDTSVSHAVLVNATHESSAKPRLLSDYMSNNHLENSVKRVSALEKIQASRLYDGEPEESVDFSRHIANKQVGYGLNMSGYN